MICVAAAIAGDTGEVFKKRLTPGNDGVIGWVRSLPGPSAVVYEAGPTGFGLTRAFDTARIRCQVAASHPGPMRRQNRWQSGRLCSPARRCERRSWPRQSLHSWTVCSRTRRPCGLTCQTVGKTCCHTDPTMPHGYPATRTWEGE
jgi:hypothetical protein